MSYHAEWLYKYVQPSIQSGDTVTAGGGFASQASIPANTLVVGSVIELDAWGIYTTTATSWNPDFDLIMNGGSSFGGLAAGPYVGAAVSNAGWHIRWRATVRAIGASGAIMQGLDAMFASNNYNNALIGYYAATANKTVDTTSAITLSAQCYPGAGTISSTLQQLIVKAY